MYCAICIMEGSKEEPDAIRAIIILGGFSVCGKHGPKIISELEHNVPTQVIIQKAMRDKYKVQ